MSQESGAALAPFIVGVGRSGTTLLRLMLDAHSQVAIPAETSFLAGLTDKFGDQEEHREPYFHFVTHFKTWPDFGLHPADYWSELTPIRPFRLSDAVRAFYRLYARRQGKPRFGDKTPTYLGRTASIHALVPETRFIHLIRDGRDVALSHRDVWFGRHRSVQEHLINWRRGIEKARRHSAGSEWYTEVRYEDLVREPEHHLRRICQFVELEFEPGMLQYFERARHRLEEVKDRHRSDGSVQVSKEERLFQHRFTSSPPVESRVLRYRTEMSEELRHECEQIAGDMLAELGYNIGA